MQIVGAYKTIRDVVYRSIDHNSVLLHYLTNSVTLKVSGPWFLVGQEICAFNSHKKVLDDVIDRRILKKTSPGVVET